MILSTIKLRYKFTRVSNTCPAYYKIIIFLLVLQSLNPWFLWNDYLKYLISGIAFLASCYLYVTNKINKKIKRNVITAALLFVLLIYLNIQFNFNGILNKLISAITYFLLITGTSNEQKIEIWKFIQKCFAWILCISLIGWCFHLIGLDTPSYYTSFGHYEYYNHFLFLERVTSYTLVERFSSVFLEPGHVGTVLPLFLYINGYDLKEKYNIIFFIALLFTLSLAGYVLLIIGLFFNFILKSKLRVSALIGFVVIIAGITLVIKTYNGGDNILNNLIIMRLEMEDGKMAGDNRVSNYIQLKYEDVMNSSSRYMGIGTENVSKLTDGDEHGNAGYKLFILSHGLTGLILVLLLYGYYSLAQSNKLCCFTFYILYCISFIQRSYPVWDIFLIILICGVPFLNAQYNNNRIL